jgi:flagellar assembly factor FliW
MKVLTELHPPHTPPIANTFTLPQGLIGFPKYTRAELLYLPDHLPFLWLKVHGPTDSVHFVVIEPAGLIPGYEPELFDEDARTLGITDPTEAMVLNIVTLEQQRPLEATVNLVGPIIVNRRTLSARQLVIANYSRYGAHHPLVAATQSDAATPEVARATA